MTNEDEAVVHMRNMGLLRIQRELQFALNDPASRDTLFTTVRQLKLHRAL